MEEDSKNEKRTKIQFELSKDAERDLDALVEYSGSTTRVDLIRRSLVFYSWFVHDVEIEDTLQVVGKDGTVKAIIPARIMKGSFRPA